METLLSSSPPHSPIKRKRKLVDEEPTPVKRLRWPLVKDSTKSPPRPPVVVHQQLPDLLNGIDKEELISIIVQLTKQFPDTEDHVLKLLPRPTLKFTFGILEGLEKKLLEAIPYSKLGPDRSDYSFNRVRPQIDELRGSLLQYLDFFTLPSSYPSSLDHEYPSESFAYLHFTTCLVHRLPIWSSNEKNRELKDPLYERLGRHWRITCQEVSRRAQEGKMFGSIVGEWAQNLNLHCAHLEGKFGFKEAFEEFNRGLGWIIGLGNPQEHDIMKANLVPFGMSSGL